MSSPSLTYFRFYKPYNCLSQFTEDVPGQNTLADYFPTGNQVYPIGRLDKDSEGLLLLSNDPSINHILLDPSHNHQRTYLVQVEGDICQDALDRLKTGLEINVKGKKHLGKMLEAQVIADPKLAHRDPPIRERKSIPTSWVKVVLSEGKNRQVRRMLAKTGFPVLRLHRASIEGLSLAELKPGDHEEIPKDVFLRLLKIKA